MTDGARRARPALTGAVLLGATVGGFSVAPAAPAGAALGAAHYGVAGSSALMPYTGIVPPKNPSKSLPPKPNFLTSSSCRGAKDTATCNKIVLSATANARKVLEAMRAMSFSLAAYEKLSHLKQLFVTANLERLDRKLPIITEMTKSLDTIAQVGAKKNEDPPFSLLPKTYKLPGGGQIISAGANWASGYDNPLGSNYGWMYDDGLGSPNIDCTASHRAGCWGHRDNILRSYGSKASCGGRAFHTVMGTGYVATGAYAGDGETELFVGVCGTTPTDSVFTWAKAVSLLHPK